MLLLGMTYNALLNALNLQSVFFFFRGFSAAIEVVDTALSSKLQVDSWGVLLAPFHLLAQLMHG